MAPGMEHKKHKRHKVDVSSCSLLRFLCSVPRRSAFWKPPLTACDLPCPATPFGGGHMLRISDTNCRACSDWMPGGSLNPASMSSTGLEFTMPTNYGTETEA